jgi:hypothetical protein
MTHNSGVFGSPSTETCRPFSVNATMFPPLALGFFIRPHGAVRALPALPSG